MRLGSKLCLKNFFETLRIFCKAELDQKPKFVLDSWPNLKLVLHWIVSNYKVIHFQDSLMKVFSTRTGIKIPRIPKIVLDYYSSKFHHKVSQNFSSTSPMWKQILAWIPFGIFSSFHHLDRVCVQKSSTVHKLLNRYAAAAYKNL